MNYPPPPPNSTFVVRNPQINSPRPTQTRVLGSPLSQDLPPHQPVSESCWKDICCMLSIVLIMVLILLTWLIM